jgi:hypothetical protein
MMILDERIEDQNIIHIKMYWQLKNNNECRLLLNRKLSHQVAQIIIAHDSRHQ